MAGSLKPRNFRYIGKRVDARHGQPLAARTRDAMTPSEERLALFQARQEKSRAMLRATLEGTV